MCGAEVEQWVVSKVDNAGEEVDAVASGRGCGEQMDAVDNRGFGEQMDAVDNRWSGLSGRRCQRGFWFQVDAVACAERCAEQRIVSKRIEWTPLPAGGWGLSGGRCQARPEVDPTPPLTTAPT